MGTKNNPGKYDCYLNADPDEPMFVLLGRDPLAADLVRLWADTRERMGTDTAKVFDAHNCAETMDLWCSRPPGQRNKVLRNLPLSALADEIERRGARVMFAPDQPVAHAPVEAKARMQSVTTPAASTSLQTRLRPWLFTCFGPTIASDPVERNHRYLEESLELVQACGCTRSEAQQLVDYVFGRPVGEKTQEAGGALITLAALCLAHAINLDEAGEVELTRIWGKIDVIRAKQAAKPRHSPLPV